MKQSLPANKSARPKGLRSQSVILVFFGTAYLAVALLSLSILYKAFETKTAVAMVSYLIISVGLIGSGVGIWKGRRWSWFSGSYCCFLLFSVQLFVLLYCVFSVIIIMALSNDYEGIHELLSAEPSLRNELMNQSIHLAGWTSIYLYFFLPEMKAYFAVPEVRLRTLVLKHTGATALLFLMLSLIMLRIWADEISAVLDKPLFWSLGVCRT